MCNFEKIAELRKIRGISATYLAAQVGRGANYIKDCRVYNINVPDEYVKKWAEILGTTVEYLTDQTDDPAVPPTLQNENDVRVALFGGENVTDEQWDEIKRFIDYVRNRDK